MVDEPLPPAETPDAPEPAPEPSPPTEVDANAPDVHVEATSDSTASRVAEDLPSGEAMAPPGHVAEVIPLTREQRRSRRKWAVRKRTVANRFVTKRELELGRQLYPDDDHLPSRPRTRGECAGVERPCPYVSCAHNLFLDVVRKTGSITFNFPDREPGDMPPDASCALDVADRGGTTLEEVGQVTNLTRERIRQLEVRGLAKLARARSAAALRDYVDEARGGLLGVRRLPVLPPGDGTESASAEAPRSAPAIRATEPPDAPAVARDGDFYRRVLPENLRGVYDQRIVNGRSREEAARDLGVSESFVDWAEQACERRLAEAGVRVRAPNAAPPAPAPAPVPVPVPGLGYVATVECVAAPEPVPSTPAPEKQPIGPDPVTEATMDEQGLKNLADRCERLIRERGPLSKSELAALMGEEPTTVGAALITARAHGQLESSGQTKAMRWHLPGQPPAAVPAPAAAPAPEPAAKEAAPRKRSALVRLHKKSRGKVKASAYREARKQVARTARKIAAAEVAPPPSSEPRLLRELREFAEDHERKAAAARRLIDELTEEPQPKPRRVA